MDYFGQLFGTPFVTGKGQGRPTTPPGMVDGNALDQAQQQVFNMKARQMGRTQAMRDAIQDLYDVTSVPLESGEPRTIDIDYEDVTDQ